MDQRRDRGFSKSYASVHYSLVVESLNHIFCSTAEAFRCESEKKPVEKKPACCRKENQELGMFYLDGEVFDDSLTGREKRVTHDWVGKKLADVVDGKREQNGKHADSDAETLGKKIRAPSAEKRPFLDPMETS